VICKYVLLLPRLIAFLLCWLSFDVPSIWFSCSPNYLYLLLLPVFLLSYPKTHCHLILLMSVLSKAICRFSAISIEIPMSFFHRNRIIPPKIHMVFQGTLNSQNNLEKEQIWRWHTPRFPNLLYSSSDQNSVVLVQI